MAAGDRQLHPQSLLCGFEQVMGIGDKQALSSRALKHHAAMVVTIE